MAQIICFYLPQFHEFEENNIWWGEGFTEWTCLRKVASSLTDGHLIRRPHPDLGYYCLLDKAVRARQAALAKEYGVYGFCYYHYWFNGKLLMQRPLEAMLADGEPDLPFCLSWANEPWTRKMNGGSEKEIIQPQAYAGVEEWDAHLDYLVRFFKNKNYILIDNKPVLLVYHIPQITNYQERFRHWRVKIKEHGFDGLFIIATVGWWPRPESVPVLPHVDGSCDYYPNFLRQPGMVDFKKGGVTFYDMSKAWQRMLSDPPMHNCHFRGLLTSFDNSPRIPGGASVFLNGSPKEFGTVLSRQLANSNREFVFVNAWNEWGEQAVLEPDDRFGYGYLEGVRRAVTPRKVYA